MKQRGPFLTNVGRHSGRLAGPCLALLLIIIMFETTLPRLALAESSNTEPLIEEALRLGEKFGVVVGEVDEETRDYLGLQHAEGVVVYEVIGGKPADLAGIKVKAIIKEIDKHEIRDLEDFGQALRKAMTTDNFTVATYRPFDPVNPSVAGGLNFHFVRVETN